MELADRLFYMKNIIPYLIIAVLLAFLLRECGNEKVSIERSVETVVVRDTVRDTLMIPYNVYVARTDTVFLPSVADTVLREVVVPIERKEYRTDDYHAVIEGYRPSLLSISVYPETKYITENIVRTIKQKPRFGVGIQAGYGITGKEVRPYIGVGLQYNIITW